MDAVHADATVAIAQLREAILPGAPEADVQDLMRLADRAVAAFDTEKDRKEIAEMLLEALTVVRFAPVFGHDASPARAKAGAILDAIVKATLSAPPAG